MNTTRRALLASLLIALTVAAGQALAGIPNVELVTFLVFVSGYLLGPRAGAIIGGCAMGAHSTFNVMGAVVPPMLAAQVLVYASIGAAGGLVGPGIVRLRAPVRAVVACATGALLALVYQVIINLVAYLTFTSEDTLAAFIWGGLVFSAVQILWNAALFFFALGPTMSVVGRYRGELGVTS